jgi:hypothetical protein
MAQTQTFYATQTDFDAVLAWFRDNGAARLSGDRLEVDWNAAPMELVVGFPSVGPVVLWPTEINLADYPENSPQWRSAVLAKIDIAEQGITGPCIDPGRSPIATLTLPELRDGRYWVGAEVKFTTSKLRERFPELHRVCQRFERFIRKHPIVFDSTQGDDQTGFGYHLCPGGVMHKVAALPEAYALLKAGAFMVEPLASPKTYAEFRRRLQLSGYET